MDIINGAMDVGISISIAVGVVTLVALVGSMFYWAGKVSERIDALVAVVEAQGARIEAQGARIDALAAEVAATRRELLSAIAHHEHDTDGSVRFRIPPTA